MICGLIHPAPFLCHDDLAYMTIQTFDASGTAALLDYIELVSALGVAMK